MIGQLISYDGTAPGAREAIEKHHAQMRVYATLADRMARGDACTDYVIPWDDKTFREVLLKRLRELNQAAEMWGKVQSVARGILNAVS